MNEWKESKQIKEGDRKEVMKNKNIRRDIRMKRGHEDNYLTSIYKINWK